LEAAKLHNFYKNWN